MRKNNKFFKYIVLHLVFLTLISSSMISNATVKKDSLSEIMLSDNEYATIELSLDYDIIIPDNFSTIQEGIKNANPGETIYVKSGVYRENIIVNKERLTLLGQSKFNTIIDGGKCLKNTVLISAENVTIQGFSITNGVGNEALWAISGVFINSSNVKVKDNLIMWNTIGLCALDIAHNLTICDNQFIEDSYFFGNYEHTTDQFSLESCFHNVYNNTVNGKPSYYFKNKNDFTVPNDAGHVILVNCSNVTISDTYFTLADFPVLLYYCNNCIVENLTVEDTYGEIITFECENITLQNNIASNMIFGICLDQRSKNCIIRNNDLSQSYSGVTVMISSLNNEVYNNNIYDNDVGVWVISSSENKIYENNIHNNLIGVRIIWESGNNSIENNTLRKNTMQAQILDRSKNYWNHNYWNRPRIFPKIIFGFKSRGLKMGLLCCINIDKNPARSPTV